MLPLGHSAFGAIEDAVDDAKLGELTALLANIKPAVEAVALLEGPRSSKNASFDQAVAEENVKHDAATGQISFMVHG